MLRRRLPLLVAPLLLAGCIAVAPASPVTNGQVVTVALGGFLPNATVWLSECGPGQAPSPSRGCTPSLSTQQAVHLGPGGSGAAKFRVASSVGGLACGGYCTINATNGIHVQQVPISFLKQGSLNIASGFVSKDFDLYVDGRFLIKFNEGSPIPNLDLNPGTYKLDFYDNGAGIPPGGTPTLSTLATVAPGRGNAVAIFPVTATKIGVVQTPVPAPPAANRVRVTFVNTTPVLVTPKLGTVTGTPLATGRSETLTLTGPANVPNGDDSWELDYPPRSGSQVCSTGDAGGLFRGHGYVMTIVAPEPPTGPTTCPYSLQALVQNGIV
jgi:hypothetical protein